MTEQMPPPDDPNAPPYHPLAENDMTLAHEGGGLSGYDTNMTGRGRWFEYSAPLGRTVATVWTNDTDSLGILVRWETGWDPTSLLEGWAAAHRAGTPVSDVFDALAATVTQGRAAGPVVSGDLSSLNS